MLLSSCFLASIIPIPTLLSPSPFPLPFSFLFPCIHCHSFEPFESLKWDRGAQCRQSMLWFIEHSNMWWECSLETHQVGGQCHVRHPAVQASIWDVPRTSPKMEWEVCGKEEGEWCKKHASPCIQHHVHSFVAQCGLAGLVLGIVIGLSWLSAYRLSWTCG